MFVMLSVTAIVSYEISHAVIFRSVIFYFKIKGTGQ